MSRYELEDSWPAQRDFVTFRRLVELEASRHSEWRSGQTAFNVLCAVRPDLSEQIRGDADLDPFYLDRRLPTFYEWLEENWG